MRRAYANQQLTRPRLPGEILVDLNVRFFIDGVAIARQALRDISKTSHVILPQSAFIRVP
jgi:hypothetical protein